VTVLEVIQKSTEFLTRKGVESARLQTELLLAHVLKLPRMKLYLNFERGLTDAETDAMRELVRRRSLREPLQHITGSAPFAAWEMAVNRHVLVPRPETELLAEAGWQFLSTLGQSPQPTPGERLDEVSGSRRKEAHSVPAARCQSLLTSGATALDFGTGSGCIAIALAAKCPTAHVTAVDISAEALAVAKQNAERNGVAGRIEFVPSDGFAALPPGSRFHLIISNPPYIPSAEIATLPPEVRDFDPRGALDGGADGLDFYRRLASEAPGWLAPGGKLMVEFGDGQAPAVESLFAGQKWIVEAVHADYSQRQRILIARRV
jgi:release factor glutamine methyltransferase